MCFERSPSVSAGSPVWTRTTLDLCTNVNEFISLKLKTALQGDNVGIEHDPKSMRDCECCCLLDLSQHGRGKGQPIMSTGNSEVLVIFSICDWMTPFTREGIRVLLFNNVCQKDFLAEQNADNNRITIFKIPPTSRH